MIFQTFRNSETIYQTKEVLWHPSGLPMKILVAGEDEMAEVSVVRRHSHEQDRVHICRLMSGWASFAGNSAAVLLWLVEEAEMKLFEAVHLTSAVG